MFKGIGPYDAEDPWKKKMFNWDIYTHEKEHVYMQELQLIPKQDRMSFNQNNDANWKAWMTANNQWISFYEWYYPSANQIEESLIKKFRNESKQKRLKTDNYVDQKLAEHAIIIPTPLQLPTFSRKIVKMLEKSDVPRHLIAVRNKGE